MSLTVPIDSIEVAWRHRQDLGDLMPLMASIEEVGLLQPVVVTPERRLIAGERRLTACRRLGLDKIDVVVATGLADLAALFKAERDENTSRVAVTVASIFEAAGWPLPPVALLLGAEVA